MTARRTALDNYTTPNPACEVCNGTGWAAVFDTDCTMCWSVRRAGTSRLHEHLHPTLGQMIRSKIVDEPLEQLRDDMRLAKAKREYRRWRWKRDHPITMRILEEMRGSNP
jgi:hypothetical protein